MNSFISKIDIVSSDEEGLFVIAKGIDTWEYYERLGKETEELI